MKSLETLFTPGPGIEPPFLGGRKGILSLMDREFARARNKQGRPVVLIGPRGNGKTVLLNRFAKACRNSDADVIRATPKTIGNESELVSWLLSSDWQANSNRDEEKLLARVPPSLSYVARKLGGWRAKVKSLGVPGLLSMEFRNLSEGDRELVKSNLEKLLLDTAQERPRVALIDEAHRLGRDVGELLLNTAQAVNNEGGKFLLVLAGTPNIHGALSRAQASFWERCREIGVGRLAEEATREALVNPLAERGVLFAENALKHVVESSQRYPYFIQLWGEALCHALPEGESEIGVDVVNAAHASVDEQRTTFYNRRYTEIEKRGLLPLAASVAKAFDELPDPVELRDLRNLAGKHLGKPGNDLVNEFESLSDLGYIWTPTGSIHPEPGIPSLMQHVQERYPNLKTDPAGTTGLPS